MTLKLKLTFGQVQQAGNLIHYQREHSVNTTKLRQKVLFLNKEWTVTKIYTDCLKGMCTIRNGKDLYCVSISKLEAVPK